MIEILSNGFRTSKSGSPVMMQSALPDIASFRYISSFGSRHAFILTSGIITEENCKMVLRIPGLVSSGKKYFLNFALNKVPWSSSNVLGEIRCWCESITSSSARNGTEFFESDALIITFVSITTRIYSSFSKSLSLSSVRPCFRACSAVLINNSFQVSCFSISVMNLRAKALFSGAIANSLFTTSSLSPSSRSTFFFLVYPAGASLTSDMFRSSLKSSNKILVAVSFCLGESVSKLDASSSLTSSVIFFIIQI